MEPTTLMRHFADSWGLLGMTLFFLGVVALRLPPRQHERSADDAARIPFEGGLIMSDKHIDEAHRRRHHRPRMGRHQGTRTRRCRAGGCGRSTPRSSGRSSTPSPIRPGRCSATATTGLLGYSSRADVSRRRSPRRRRRRADYCDAIASKSARRDPRRRRAAAASRSPAGRSAFQVNCVQCHGSGAAGLGRLSRTSTTTTGCGAAALDDIHQHDRARHPLRRRSRHARRPRCRPSADDARAGADRRRQRISSHRSPARTGDANARERRPASCSPSNCAACHGEDGKGNRELGAPDLTDAIWLYGSATGRDRRPGQRRRGTASCRPGRPASATPRSRSSRSTSIRSAAASSGRGARRGQ